MPLFYERSVVDDVPYKWVARMKTAMQNLAPIFNTKRMVTEYAEQLYFPTHQRWLKLNENEAKRSIALAHWKSHIQDHWGNLWIEEKSANGISATVQNLELGVGESTTVQTVVHTDVLFPHELAVQIYHGVLDTTGEIHNGNATPMEYKADLGGGAYLFEGTLTLKQTGLHGYTVRALPYHEDLESLSELGLITWA